MKRAVQRLLARFGYRLAPLPAGPPGPARAPLGELGPFLAALADRGFSPHHLLDVGAHRGDWSRAARAVFPAAGFTLVEPLAEMAPALERFCANTPGARWIRAGAAAESGERELVVFADRGSSSFLPAADDPAGEESRRLPVVTLDSLFAEADSPPPPELIKIDAEGLELEALAGAGELLARAELVVLEAALFAFRPGQPTLAGIVRFMDERGFVPYDLPWFLRRPLDGALGLVDVAFARRDGRLRRDRRWAED